METTRFPEFPDVGLKVGDRVFYNLMLAERNVHYFETPVYLIASIAYKFDSSRSKGWEFWLASENALRLGQHVKRYLYLSMTDFADLERMRLAAKLTRDQETRKRDQQAQADYNKSMNERNKDVRVVNMDFNERSIGRLESAVVARPKFEQAKMDYVLSQNPRDKHEFDLPPAEPEEYTGPHRGHVLSQAARDKLAALGEDMGYSADAKADETPMPYELITEPACYLILKKGYYYRPNCEGYTNRKTEAGRYTLLEAKEITHPNGINGPRDGMSYVHSWEAPEFSNDQN